MYKLCDGGVIRLADGIRILYEISTSPDLTEYNAWLAKGNTPLPAFTAEELAEKQRADEAAAREKLIAEKMRELAISELKKEGKLPQDYKMVKY